MKKIPNHLDDPAQMLFWEADEFLILSTLFGVGLAVSQLATLVVLGLALLKFYRKVRDRRPEGFMLHALYWHAGVGAKDENPGSRPNPFIRRYF